MVAYTQEERRFSLETPLGKDVLLLTRFTGHEEMSRLFIYQLEMLSDKDSIAAKDIVGKNVTVAVKLLDDTQRCFNGFVSRFAYCGTDDRLSHYTAEVVPWLWFLTRTADCRIFQQKSVPEIIEQIFKDLGFSNYEVSQIKGNHPIWDYCVQYRETDFNFVSRLMEQEGIFYFFRHENGKHTLVLADQKNACQDCPEKEVEFAAAPGASTLTDQVTSWEHRYRYCSGKWAQTDYNFETPGASLMARTNTVIKLDSTEKYEIYDYPGEYEKKAEGEAEVKIRMEEEEVSHDVVMGSSKCRTFTPGGKFKLKGHHSPAEKGKGYVIVAIEHSASLTGAYVSGGAATEMDYQNTFTCIPDSVTFRPARTTPKPVVQGVQTAVVVGPDGEEIFTDKYGRVKVQFFWDREGKKDDKSSCWVRVAQLWAGKAWGAMHIPRIGQEVIVDFLEGDPDRPIITGRFYNADQMPPYLLPDNKTQSGIKSRSSKGGDVDNFNEIRMEDKKGVEQIFINAEKDMDLRVEHDSREFVGNDRHLIVKANQSEKVESDKHLTVSGNHNEKVAQNISIQAGMDWQEKTGKNYAHEAGNEIHLKGGMKVVIEGGVQLTIKGPGGFVDIGAGGVTIQGILVKINSGGAAGTGSGSSPKDPKEPDQADDGSKGTKL